MFARKIAAMVPGKAPVLAGVARVSLEIQVANYSLETQAFDFAGFEEKFHCRIPEEFQIEDQGFGGADFNRPSIKRVVRWIREGKVDGVAYPHVDRFARDVEGGLALIRMIVEAGGQVLIGNLGWYSDERTFRNQLVMYLMMSQNAKEDIQYKSRGGVLTKVRKGLAHGGGRSGPYGYRFVSGLELAMEATKAGRVPDKKPQNELRRVEDNIKIYHLICDLILQGESAAGVCREMLSRGVPSPRGKQWNATFIAKIAHDECYYTGEWFYNKRQAVAPDPKRIRRKGDRHRVNASWKKRDRSEWLPYKLPGGPLVSKERWSSIVEALERNRIVHNGRPGDYLLSNLVTCLQCGSCVSGKKRKRPTGKIDRWYGCTKRDRVYGDHTCTACGLVRANILEDAVWEATRQAVCHDLERLVAQHRETILEDTDTAEMERCTQELERVTKKMVDASRLHDREDDDTLKREYASQVADWKGQKKLLERRLSSFSTEAQEINVDTKTIARTCARAFDTTDPAKRRAILLAWVEGIKYAEGKAELTLRIPKSSNEIPSEPSSWREPKIASAGGAGKHTVPSVTLCEKGECRQRDIDPFYANGLGFVYLKLEVVI